MVDRLLFYKTENFIEEDYQTLLQVVTEYPYFYQAIKALERCSLELNKPFASPLAYFNPKRPMKVEKKTLMGAEEALTKYISLKLEVKRPKKYF